MMTSLRRAFLILAATCACLFSVCVSEAFAVNASVCGELMEQYSIVPYNSWGSAPGDVKKIWGESDCNHKVCEYMKDTYSVVPYKSWGSLPADFRKIWDTPEVNCNKFLE